MCYIGYDWHLRLESETIQIGRPLIIELPNDDFTADSKKIDRKKLTSLALSIIIICC